MKLFTDPGHLIIVAVPVIALAIYLVSRRRRRNVEELLDDDHQHPPGHGHQDGAGHRSADTERHHP